jgi:magnesium transporter
MNFEFMPELHWRYAYFVVLAVTAVICVGLFFAFRRARWL